MSTTVPRGVERCGTPHTAGSDALATLELYFQVRMEDVIKRVPSRGTFPKKNAKKKSEVVNKNPVILGEPKNGRQG